MLPNPTALTPIYEKAWREPQFKQSLLHNPLATLQLEGITLPEGLNFIAVAESDTHRYIVIPVEGSPEKSAETLLEYVRSKAMQDEAFKQSLLADPKTILSEELGQAIPENVQVTVVEETGDTRYLVIPPQPDLQYVIERAWQDSIFKQNLLSEPQSTLAQIGIIADENQEIKVKEGPTLNKGIFSINSLFNDLAATPQGDDANYENSLLTALSRDIFGGNSLCVGIFCLKFDDTKGSELSLNALDMCQNIMNFPVQNDNHVLGLLRK